MKVVVKQPPSVSVTSTPKTTVESAPDAEAIQTVAGVVPVDGNIPVDALAAALAFGEAGTIGITHDQNTSSAIWYIVHPLPFDPNVTLVDSAGDQFFAEIHYEPGIVTVIMNSPQGGKAFLS